MIPEIKLWASFETARGIYQATREWAALRALQALEVVQGVPALVAFLENQVEVAGLKMTWQHTSTHNKANSLGGQKAPILRRAVFLTPVICDVRFQDLTMQTYDHHFLEDPFRDLKVNAAMVGISDRRWEYVPEAEAGDEVGIRSRMRAKRFDVMPIVSSDETREYFVTVSWNDYSTIVRKPIRAEDLIAYDTDLREVIRRFALDKRHFYFLSGSKPVVGLISVVNLNCRQVKVFLFNLIAELELILAASITRSLSDAALLAMAEDRTGAFAESLKYYEEAKREGVDAPFVEYLTLPTLINVGTSQRLYEAFGYSRTRFEKLGRLRSLRNAVAHPARSLVTDPSSCVKLWEKLQMMEEVLAQSRET